MHRAIRILAVILTTGNLFGQAVPPATATTRLPTKEALVLTIRSDRPTYRMSDEIELQTQIANNTNHDVYIWTCDFDWYMAYSLSMRITTADGSRVPVKMSRGDPPPPPPRAGHPEQFIRIGGSSFHGTVTQFAVKDLVPRPGEYDVSVTQESSFPARWLHEELKDDPIAKLPLRMNGDPVLTSNQLHISVEP